MKQISGSIASTPPDPIKLALTRRALLGGSAALLAEGATGPLRLLAAPLRTTPDVAAAPAAPCLTGSRGSYPPLLQRFIDKLDPAADVFPTEVYAAEVERVLAAWSHALTSGSNRAPGFLAPSLQCSSLMPSRTIALRADGPLRVQQHSFPPAQQTTAADLAKSWAASLASLSSMELAEFQIFGVRVLRETPLRIETDVRYDLLGVTQQAREGRVGSWTLQWQRAGTSGWLTDAWTMHDEVRSSLTGPGFQEITSHVLDLASPASTQLAHGIDHWRTVLDAATGIDVYGNHGIAAGDIDGSGFDSLYVCQPSGLPNRLLRNRGDGTLEDVTDRSGTGLLDGTASALFADFQNRGKQDLLVVRSSGPMLFENVGNGRFEPRPNAFRFARPAQGTFTSVAVADYNRDGLLDVYFCLYSYYQGLDRYGFPSPYYDAQNGPPNFLFRNRGDGTFDDVTVPSGMDANNNRFSFAAEWCDFDDDGWPDLYIANDFGRKNLYRNNRDGTFSDVAATAGVEDYGPGMSTCWLDCDGDGRQDLYVANMWLPEGRRITANERFLPTRPEAERALYRKHNAGNSMYRNRGDGTFADETVAAGTAQCGWSWSCAAWDFDHDGWPDLYVANGFVTGPDRFDLQSFFWRQVAQRSADAPGKASDYEMAWNAVNELVRSDYSWSGAQRNVFFRNNRGAAGGATFADVGGVLGLDFRDDSRAFALADFDGDGRLEFALKNRTGPQLRVVRNNLEGIGHAVAVRLVGHTSNRDAIGAVVTLESGGRRQVRQLSAGSGFASQHTKEIFFGVGEATVPVSISVRWPSGSTQRFEQVPVDRRVTFEEGKPDFHAVQFAKPSTAMGGAAALPTPASPTTVSTWLAAPLFGPELSLQAADGATHTLSGMRGKPVALVFLKRGCGDSNRQLAALQSGAAALRTANVALFVVNVAANQAQELQPVGEVPLLPATEQQLAAWKIQYRYLFERRRDLSYPSTFLLDAEGATVRLHQGFVTPAQLLEDVKATPRTADARLAKATPYSGPYLGNAVVRDSFTYAVAFAEYGLNDDSIAALRQSLKQNPEHAAAWFNLGTLLLGKKQYGEAQTALREAVRLNPQDSDAWNNLGMIAGEQNDYAAALAAFRNSALADPNHLTAVQNMMGIYQYQQRPADAQQAMQELVDKAPENADLRLGLAMAMLGQSNTAGGLAELEIALRLRPDFPDALNNLGTALLQTGDIAGALRAFQRCRASAPDLDRPVLNEALLYRRTGDLAKARAVLQQFLATHPQSAAVQQMLAKLEAQ